MITDTFNTVGLRFFRFHNHILGKAVVYLKFSKKLFVSSSSLSEFDIRKFFSQSGEVVEKVFEDLNNVTREIFGILHNRK